MGPLSILFVAGVVVVPTFCALIVEERVCKRVGARFNAPSGLQSSFHQELRALGKKRYRPDVMVFPSVKEAAYAVRGIRGDGTILISQGFLAGKGASEEVLREVLRNSLVRLRGARLRIVPASLALWGWLAIDRAASGAIWKSTRHGGVDKFSTALLAVVLYPWLRTSHRWSRRSRVEGGALPPGDGLFI